MKNFLLIPVICSMFVSCSGNSDKQAKDSGSCPRENNETQSDWKITANVKKAIMMDSSLSSHARMVSVTTNQGNVTLSGTVASKDEMHKIVKIAKNVSGVESVNNNMTVSQECSQ